ncbi:hypothetical protein, partial [Marinobacterium arenosum]|uniref:hypothetical protein n=1 Tax=Marinobacterium arenosum TaxID=2862496 RepID=UPI001C952F5F
MINQGVAFFFGISLIAGRMDVVSAKISSQGISKAHSAQNRVGGGLTASVLSHHRTYGSVYGGSCHTFEPMVLSHQRYQS